MQPIPERARRAGGRWQAASLVVPTFAALAVIGAGVFAGILAAVLVPGCSGDRADAPVLTPEDTRPGLHGEWAGVPAQSPPLNLILLTLDTTRQDHLSCYGFDKPTTPNLDRIAAEGLLFDRATTPVPVTLPAHSTIMTGLYPYEHAVRNNGTYALNDRFRTLAEILKEHGYATGAIVGAFPVEARFGLNQGFDHYDDDFPATSVRRESDTAQRPAADVTRLGLEWIEAQKGPFFLWLHYFDPHYPYEPPSEFRNRFPGDLYAAEIASMDSAVGTLLDTLEARGLLRTTVIMVVGDHGESLGEHRELTHSIFVYNATQRIPFLLRLPDTAPFAGASWRGRRIEAPANLTDCLPTALNALGIPADERPRVNGRSLLPVVQGEDDSHRWVYFESLVPRLEHSWSDLRGIEAARWKYIRAPRPELYDVENDPGETRNLVEREPQRARAMEAALSEILKRDPGDAAGQVTMDKETVEKLRSLGYVAGSPSAEASGASGPLPDPKDMIASYERVNAALTLVAAHLPDRALALVDSVLAVNPRDAAALRIRGSCLVRLGRGEEAAAVYDSLLRACAGCPDQEDLLEGRAMAAMAAGDLEDALERSRVLVESAPDEPTHRILLARVLERKGDRKGAADVLETAMRLFPDDPSVPTALGELRADAGADGPAEAAYRAALERNPDSPDALVGLGEVLLTEGRTDEGRAAIARALAIDPSHPGALFRTAWFLKQEGRRGEAMRLYREALARDPEHFPTLYNLGNLALESGDLNEALRLYTEAARSPQATPELFVNLGVVYANMGRFQEAAAQWEKAIALDPDNPQVPQIRQNIQRARQAGGLR